MTNWDIFLNQLQTEVVSDSFYHRDPGLLEEVRDLRPHPKADQFPTGWDINLIKENLLFLEVF